jgi:transposase-like protein
MGRKPRVDRSPEETWQIVQEGIKSGNVSETCRRHGIAPNLHYRRRDELETLARLSITHRRTA